LAKEIAADYRRLIAGTINPCSPKKIVSATDMSTWLETPMQLLGSHAAVEPARSQERSS
jgi:hypothetical protein